MVVSANRVETTEATEVLSPYDGQVPGSAPTGTTEHIDASIAAAKAALG